MRVSLLPSVVLFLASGARAYDRVEYLAAYQLAEFQKPSGVAATAERLYVADPKASTVWVLDLADGKLLGRSPAGKGGPLEAPAAVAVGPDGTVYAADPGSSRVVMLDPDGKPLGWFGGKGSEPGRLRDPQDVAVGPGGRVYVADAGNGRVQIYSKDGIFMFGFGAEVAAFSSPSRIAVDLSERVYVLDDRGRRMRRFAIGDDGAWKVDGLPVTGAGFAVDAFGFVYSVDAAEGKVREHEPGGKVEGTFGTAGEGKGQFKEPADLALDPGGGILVADPGNRRVLRYRVENAAKTAELPVNKRTKILITGPTWTAAAKVGAFVPLKEGLYGYLLDARTMAKLGEDGKPALSFAPHGKDKGQVREPAAVAWDKEHGLVVSDTQNDRIQFFDEAGKPTGLFGEKSGWFGSKSKEGRVSDPEGVALTDKGTVFVADTGNKRVQAFDKEGVFLFSIGPSVGGLTLQAPCCLQYDPKGALYILDRGLKKLVHVEPNGKFVRAWGTVGERSSDWQEPVAMAYDGNNYLYILDRAAGRLRVYDTAGAWITNFFAKGKGEKDVTEPSAIAFKGYKLYISDPGSSRVMSYDVRPVLAPPQGVEAKGAEGKASLSWKSEEPWAAKFRVSRASAPAGPYEELKSVAEPKLTDSPDVFYATYYYRIATVAKTGDAGPPSNAVAVYVPGSFNVPPVDIAKVNVDHIFSANYKYYLENPVGTVVLSNNVDKAFQGAQLSFFFKEFMDFPSSIEVPEIPARAKLEVPLKATLNNRILDVSEDTPILAEFKVTYYDKGKEQALRKTKPVKVLSRNAIIWDRPERMANFITPNDDPIVDFRAAALNADPKPKFAPRSQALNSAMLIWSALGSIGAGFQPDPVNPYAELKGAENHPLDRVQMPRETLRRKSGECDDLVGLLASLFEAAGAQTALLDYPAHLALMVHLKAADPVSVGLPEELLIKHKDSLWLPVEATMVGKPFLQAVEQAAGTFRKMEKSGDARIIELAEARKEFDPVTLPKEAASTAPEAEKLKAAFEADAKALDKARYDYLKGHFQGLLKKDEKDAAALAGLGVLEAQSGDAAEARKVFERALELDSVDPAALNNLGNLAYAEKDYAKAAELYKKAALADPADPGILLNRARAHVMLGQAEEAKKALAAAVEKDDALGPMAKEILRLKP